MTKQTQQILTDLYALDPGFKKNEKQLIELVEKLISAKPDLSIDPEFARTLRVQLMERAEELGTVASVPGSNLINVLKRWIYPFAGGAIVTALIFVTIVTINSKMTNTPLVAFKNNVTELYDNAIGTPEGLSADNNTESATEPAISDDGGPAEDGSSAGATQPPSSADTSTDARIMAVSDTTADTQESGDAEVAGPSADSAGVKMMAEPYNEPEAGVDELALSKPLLATPPDMEAKITKELKEMFLADKNSCFTEKQEACYFDNIVSNTESGSCIIAKLSHSTDETEYDCTCKGDGTCDTSSGGTCPAPRWTCVKLDANTQK